MLQKIERQIFMEDAPGRIHHLERPDYASATGLAKQVIDQMASEFQVAPPVTLHLVQPRLMAGVWAMTRESLVAGDLDRSRREAIAAATAQINECPFCVDVHTMMLHGSGEHRLAKTMLKGDDVDHGDEGWARLIEWAEATLSPSAEVLREPPFSPEDAPQIIGTAVAFHYINRMVNVFVDDSPLPLPRGLRWLRGTAGRFAGWAFGRRLMGISVEPGKAVFSVRDATLPSEFEWARSNPSVADAFATFAAVAEEAGRQALPEEVRRVVTEQVGKWTGTPPPLGRQWIDDPIATLNPTQRPAATLALLTALASYRVDDAVIAAFRKESPDDASLVGATAWASYVAARRISTWIDGAQVRDPQTPAMSSTAERGVYLG